MSAGNSPTYTNPHARTYKIPPSRSPNSSHIHKFHQSLPSYSPSPLIPLPDVAKSLGIKAVFIKDESSRFDLPSFKILGASWGTFRAVTDHLDLPLDEARLDILPMMLKPKGSGSSRNDGNHGRAVREWRSYKASVRRYTSGASTRLIASENGCIVTAIEGDYDTAVRAQTSRPKYVPMNLGPRPLRWKLREIPRWIVEGYSTMLDEIDSQVRNRSLAPTLLITPVGVGSLAHAVVSHCKSVEPPVSVLTVEPDTAACLHASLVAGKLTPFQTTGTIMNGLDCGTVSLTAWPDLHAGVDASTTVSDLEAHRAVEYLASQGIRLGPCGAAGLAALQRIAASDAGLLGLGADSVVVILGTEGMRPYPVPVSS
ncbi:LOW QUALITY PROTEIN: putatiave diaminopropionate ammonia lyase [Coccidioides immitis H538.4]|uniref:Putatiave diaminopropionate ammonia lyase n=1 Tax=Coccidioides immitis H538.4 TaxID=396776 RepID=A0A0J8RC35_COCIT|nr:LOW QUALITY PROTEIN: putatiave diaminopropionate ammonia lyase [Coccidioides immitis H538.4]